METYTKYYTQLPPAAVTALVEKYQSLHKTVGTFAGLRIPKVVNVTEGSITFYHIDVNDYQSLPNLIATGGGEEVAAACKRLGILLAQIHQATKGGGYIHGDFWPGNVYLSKDEVLLLDWEPPRATTDDWQQYMKGDIEFDVACFIEHVIFMFSATQWYRYFMSHQAWQEAFLAGYSETGGMFDADLLKLYRQSVRQTVWQNINVGQSSVVKKIALRFVHLRHGVVNNI